MPSQGQSTAQDGLRWLEISDFSAGMITNSDFANTAAGDTFSGSANPVPGTILGQAQSAVGCISLPNGGLAPLPGYVGTIQVPEPPAGEFSIINGFFINGPIVYNGGDYPLIDSLVVGYLTIDTTGHLSDWYLIDLSVQGTTLLNSSYIIDDLNLAWPKSLWCNMTGDTTRMNGWNAESATVSELPPGSSYDGTPTLAMAYWSNPYLIEGVIYCYPDPSSPPMPILNPGGVSPSSAAPYDAMFSDNEILSWDSGGGVYVATSYPLDGALFDVICHQNRVVCLRTPGGNATPDATQIDQAWGPNGLAVYANEFFDYPDPPNGNTLPLVPYPDGSGSTYASVQDEVFVQEHPFGHGAWGSISASELFLVKNSGGAYVIQGDLNAPTVTRLPGVTSTYGQMCRTADTPIGLVYASKNRGIWVWNGTNQAVKLSSALEDSSFLPSWNGAALNHGPAVDCRSWGGWLLVSNNWLMDTTSGGWWQLPLTTHASPDTYRELAGYTWYGVSWDGDYLYAAQNCIPTSDAGTGHNIDIFSRLVPASTYTWTSYPVRPPDIYKNRPMDIEEVVIRAQGVGTITVTLTGLGGSSSSATTSPSDTLTFTSQAQPVVLRMRSVIKNVTDVIVNVTSEATTPGQPAPILYSIAVGYSEQAQPVNAT